MGQSREVQTAGDATHKTRAEHRNEQEARDWSKILGRQHVETQSFRRAQEECSKRAAAQASALVAERKQQDQAFEQAQELAVLEWRAKKRAQDKRRSAEPSTL